jgi:hypothetical protein
MNTVLTNLVNRPTTSSRGRVPSPLNTKFTGVDKDLSFSDFKAKLANAFARFPESLSTDHDKVHYALNSMDTPAFSYFSPYLSGEVVDSDSILNNYSNFLSTLERLYGNKNKTHSIESKLSNLRQTGSVTEYITEFQKLSAQVQWNDAALTARFKEGLSNNVKRGLISCWDTLTTLADTQAKALIAYQNQEHLHRTLNTHTPQRRPQPYPRPPATSTSSTTGPTPMDLDQVRSKKLTREQKDYRRQNGLCLYCGESGHFADKCPKKSNQLAQINFSFDTDSGNDSA